MTTPHDPTANWYTPDAREYASEIAGFQTSYAHRPDVVVAARHAEDVRAAVEYAARHHLPVATQSTGHGLSVPADGGLLVTTRRLDDLHIDADRRTARIGAGVRAGALVDAAAEHGLAPLNGSSPSVGMIGYLLGGGVGLMFREFGYAADRITSIDLVTADGRRRTVTPADELFAAVPGTGGNFGVVTGLEMGLVPVTRIFGGQLLFDSPLVRRALTAWRDWTTSAPASVTSSLALVRFPDLAILPTHLRGRFVASIRVVSTDTTAHAEDLVAPLRAIGSTLSDDLRVMPYTGCFSVYVDPEDPHAYAATNALVSALPDDAVERLLAVLGAEPATVVDIRHLGGGASRASGPNAIGHRDANYAVRLIGEGDGTTEPAAFADLLGAVGPWTTGRHLNFVYGAAEAAGADQTESGYEPDLYSQLVAMKTKYDPTNMFRFNRNIPPAG